MKKTVLLVSGTMNRGGSEAMVMDLLWKLHPDFHFALLIHKKKGTTPVGDFDEEIARMNIPMYYIDSPWDIGLAKYQRQFGCIVDQIGHVDIIHSHLNTKGGIIAKCAAKKKIPRRIVHSHAKLVFEGSLLHRLWYESERQLQMMWINRYATDFWGCSPEAMQSLFSKKHQQGDRAQVIHNAVDIGRLLTPASISLREELGIDPDAIIIGSVGRMALVKNYELSAEVIKTLWQQGHKVHYVLAGRIQDQACADRVFALLGHSDRFHYLGVRSDVQTIYQGLDLYLGTSKREGLGLSAIEAQACATPCVLSDGFPTLCDVGADLVTFVHDTDPEAYAKVIQSVLGKPKNKTHKEVIALIQKAGFDIDQEADRVKQLYDEEKKP